MRVEVVADPGGRSGEWDDLVARQPLASPFLRSWWVPAAAGATPVVLLCLDGDRLVGGAAFEEDVLGRGPATVRRLRSLGQGVLAPDHLDVIALPGRDDEVVERVVGWLRRPGHRVVDLEGLAAGGRLARALAVHEIDRTGAPWAPLPAAADDYLAGLPGSLRSTIARSRKRLVKAGGAMRDVEPDDAERALDDLARLHDQRWADESAFLAAWARFRAAARVGLERGEVRIREAVDPDGVVVATELDLVVADRVAFYQAGRSTEREWRGVGSVVKADVIAAAVARGAAEYDLLRGDEGYKSDWATRRRELVRIRFGVGAGRAVAAGAEAWRDAQPTIRRIRSRAAALSDRGASGRAP
jgi:CelD/BcsL family acetyltransferase involved in cellulose biosynthesis